jgi:hypothetical protein
MLNKHWLRSLNHTLYKFVNLDCFGVTGCLLTLIPPPLSSQIETQSDERVLQDVLNALRDIYGTDNVPQPINYIVTRWGTDPYARGSYHYLPVNSGVHDIRTLAQPVLNRLYFAGEATSEQDGQTVHGALGSGKRVAEQIITHATSLYTLPQSKFKPATAVQYPLLHYKGVQKRVSGRRKQRKNILNNVDDDYETSEDETECYCSDNLVGGDIITCEDCTKNYHMVCKYCMQCNTMQSTSINTAHFSFCLYRNVSR